MPHPRAGHQFPQPCPSPSPPHQSFAMFLRWFNPPCLLLGGQGRALHPPPASSQGGREPRGLWHRCAGACSWVFWLARATAARSPPGRWPNGMAGWLPALALIAASLRFEVTRSFQSFISPPSPYFTPVSTPSRQQASTSARLYSLGPGEHQLKAPASPGIPRCQEGTCHYPRGHLHPCEALLLLETLLRAPETSSQPPQGKKKPQQTPRPVCRRFVPRHSPSKIIRSCRHSLPSLWEGVLLAARYE